MYKHKSEKQQKTKINRNTLEQTNKKHDKYFHKQQTHDTEDEEEPEISQMNIAQQIQETYIQYYPNGGKKPKYRPEYKIDKKRPKKCHQDIRKLTKIQKQTPTTCQ